MSNTDTMKQVYLLAQEHCGLKVGNWVKVARKAEDYEAGWDYYWSLVKDELVGKTGKILEKGNNGITVGFIGDDERSAWYFPYFVLEKTAKPAHKFKPFDMVLVRNLNCEQWEAVTFSHCSDDENFNKYCAAGSYWKQCIHYDGNEHLVGTTDEPEE